jgi:hypothetical protein
MCSCEEQALRLLEEKEEEEEDFSRQIFEKYYFNFHENPASGSRVVPCGRADGLTDMMKIIVAFRNFSNSPVKESTAVFLILFISQPTSPPCYTRNKKDDFTS